MIAALTVLLAAGAAVRPGVRADAAGTLGAATIDTAAIARSVRDEMRDTRTPGAAIAIVANGRIAYAAGFGVASIESGAPVTPDMLFRVGSVTKMFTGLTAATLAHEGTLDLHTPVGRHARGLAPELGRLTLDQLLSHTAGMTNEAAGDGPHDDAALGVRVRGWGTEHLFAPPGDIYSYSGPGYWLAGYAIEQAAGAPYADVVAREVLRPLGMTRSTFRPLMAMTWPLALDHRVTGDSVRLLRPYPDDVTTWPSGSLFSSVTELARLALALMDTGRVDGRQAIAPEVVRAMRTRHATVPGGACGYTYGLSDCPRGAVPALSHYGFRVGSGAVFTVLPEQRAAVIILANRNGAIFGRTERVAVEMLAPAARDSSGTGGSVTTAEPRIVSLDRSARSRFRGVYVSGPDTLRLIDRGDSLVYRYGNTESAVRRYDGDSTSVLIMDGDDVAQQFMLVRGRGGTPYLHDGLNAFRRVRSAR